MRPRGGRPWSLILSNHLLPPGPRSALRGFHDYFVTHLPSSSLHPDSRSRAGPSLHKLPRSESKPFDSTDYTRVPSALPPPVSAAQLHAQSSRDTTVVRIPLRSAKHHFGATTTRGSRPYNEDRYQAGTIDIPAFAKRKPVSITRRPGSVTGSLTKEQQGAQSSSGDPQVFYFGVFDGHGGEVCSDFLRDRLHTYVEVAASRYRLQSSLKLPVEDCSVVADREQLQSGLVTAWKDTVGGYFKRFRPEHFDGPADEAVDGEQEDMALASLPATLTYAFLKADLEFVQAQARKHSEPENSRQVKDDPVLDDRPLNHDDVLGQPSKLPANMGPGSVGGGRSRFKGGSTCSVVLVSTPTPTPFWHPMSPSTLIVAHVGDTRILLCNVSDGRALHLTSDHHPSTPIEATRLRRYASTFITDSFGEERMLGLANTRAFGDIASKAVGVSAEPEIASVQLAPGQYSFFVIMSDGVSGTLSDQEIVDIVKEAPTPEQASKDVVDFAVEVGGEGDNATCMVVRLGGWERRGEGGLGSMGTKEMRDYKKSEAEVPRARTA